MSKKQLGALFLSSLAMFTAGNEWWRLTVFFASVLVVFPEVGEALIEVLPGLFLLPERAAKALDYVWGHSSFYRNKLGEAGFRRYRLLIWP